MLSRRSLLGRLMAAPVAAVAALPLLQAAAALAPAAEEDGAATLTAIETTLPPTLEYAAPVVEPGYAFPVGKVFDESEIVAQDGRLLFREVGPDFIRHVSTGMREALVRGSDGLVRRWALP